MKIRTKRTLLRVISAGLIFCFVMYDFAWAMPVARINANTLAQGTLFTSDPDAFQKVLTGWADKGGLDIFRTSSIAAAQEFLEKINSMFQKKTQKVSGLLRNIPNGFRHGQFFISEEHKVIRCFDPDRSPYFPIDKYHIIWDISPNRLLRFQLLEQLEVGSQPNIENNNTELNFPEKESIELKYERPNLPKGHLINGFDLIINEFNGGTFTRKDFLAKQNMSEDTADNQILYLRQLGILEHFGESRAPLLRIRRSIYLCNDDLRNGIENILVSMYSDPNKDEISKARIEIDSLILEEGIKEVVRTTKKVFETKDHSEIIDMIIKYWPDRELTAGEKERIGALLSQEEAKYFYWVVDLIYREKINNDGKVLIGSLIDRLSSIEPSSSVYSMPQLKDKDRGVYKRKEKSYEDILEIMKVLRDLPEEHKWITGAFFNNWQIYSKIDQDSDKTVEEKNRLFDEGEELFFKALPDALEARLRDEYQDMVANGGIMIFPDFIFELWPIGEDFGYDKELKVYLMKLDGLKKEIYDVLQKKKRSKNCDLRLLRAYEYFLKGETGNAIKNIESILDEKGGHKDSEVLYEQIAMISKLSEKMKFLQKLRMWDLYFRQNKTIETIRAETRVKEEEIRRKLYGLDTEFYKSLSYENRYRMIRDGVERIDMMLLYGEDGLLKDEKGQTEKYASIIRQEKWLEIDGSPNITNRVLGKLYSNSFTLEMDKDGYVEFPEKFYDTFGKIKNVIFIWKPRTRVLRVQAAPGLFPSGKFYDAGNIRPKGNVPEGFKAIVDNYDLQGRYFTVTDFRLKRVKSVKKDGTKTYFSDSVIRAELNAMVYLEILYKKGNKYILREKYLRAPPEMAEKIKSVLLTLPAYPQREKFTSKSILKAKKDLDLIEVDIEKINGFDPIYLQKRNILFYYLTRAVEITEELTNFTSQEDVNIDRDKMPDEDRERLIDILETEFSVIAGQKEYLDKNAEGYISIVSENIKNAILDIDNGQYQDAIKDLSNVILALIQKHKEMDETELKRSRHLKISAEGYLNELEKEPEVDVSPERIPQLYGKLLWQERRKYFNVIDKQFNERSNLKDIWLKKVVPFTAASNQDSLDAERIEALLSDLYKQFRRGKVREKELICSIITSAKRLNDLGLREECISQIRAISKLIRLRMESIKVIEKNTISNSKTKNGLFKRVNYIHLRNLNFMTRINRVEERFNQGDIEGAKKILKGIVANKEIKAEPDFGRMLRVLWPIIHNLEKNENAGRILKRNLRILKDRIKLSDFGNAFIVDLYQGYVDKMSGDEPGVDFNKMFREKYNQYLQYAKEKGIGRGSPRLIYSYLYFSTYIGTKNKNLKDSFIDLIRILEIGKMDLLIANLPKTKFKDLIKFLKDISRDSSHRTIDELKDAEYEEVLSILGDINKLDGISREKLLDSSLIDVSGKRYEAMKNSVINRGDTISAFNFIWNTEKFRTGKFSRKDFQKKRYKDTTPQIYSYSTISRELNCLVELGILNEERVGNEYVYEISNKYLRAPPILMSYVRDIIQILSGKAHPREDQINEARITLKELFSNFPDAKERIEIERDKARKVFIEKAARMLDEAEPYMEKLLRELSEMKNKMGLRIKGCFVTGNYSLGWIKPGEKNLNIVVTVPSRACEHEVMLVENRVGYVIRAINKESPVKFNVSFAADNTIKEDSFREKICTLDKKDYRDEFLQNIILQGYDLVDLTEFLEEPDLIDTGFLAKFYKKIAAHNFEEDQIQIRPKVMTLLKKGVKMSLAGMRLQDLSSENELKKHLKNYCVIQNETGLLNVFINRIKAEEKEVKDRTDEDNKNIKRFDAVFNVREALKNRKDPLKIVHVRGGRGSEGITKEMTNFAKEKLIDLTIIPGAVDDGRSFADMALYLNDTGVPDMGKCQCNMGLNKAAVDFAMERIIKRDKKKNEKDEKIQKVKDRKSAIQILKRLVEVLKNEKIELKENDEVDREVIRLKDYYSKIEGQDIEKKKKYIRKSLESFQRIIETQSLQGNDLDISTMPMRSIILIGSQPRYSSWQKTIDNFGKFVETAGKVVLSTEKRLHAMAILTDGTFLPTENALNELQKRGDILAVIFGPRSFVDKAVLNDLLTTAKPEWRYGFSKEEKEKFEWLRTATRDELAKNLKDPIKIIDPEKTEAFREFIGYIQANYSFEAENVKIMPLAVEVIKEADAILYGPTDIESNILSALGNKLHKAIKGNNSAVKIQIANADDKHNIEPEGTTTKSQMERLYRYMSDQQRYLVPGEPYWGDLTKYISHVLGREQDKTKAEKPIEFDEKEIQKEGAKPVALDLELLDLENESTGEYGANYTKYDEERENAFTDKAKKGKERAKKGKYNVSFVVDTVLSLALLKKIETEPEEKKVIPEIDQPVSESGYDWRTSLQSLFNLMITTRDLLVKMEEKSDYMLDIMNQQKKNKICILIDKRIGAGRKERIVDAFHELIRTKDPLLQILLSRIDILSVDMDPSEIQKIQERYKLDKQNMVFLCNSENKDALDEYKGDSVITLIDDKELSQEYYYPLAELMYFSLALTGIFGHTHEDILAIFHDIPNKISSFSDEDFRDMSTIRKIYIIKLGIPKAGGVTAEAGIYQKIAQYIEAQA